MNFDSFAASPKLIEALEKRSSVLPTKEGQTLFRQGEPCKGLYILENGEAALVLLSPAGRIVMCHYAGSSSVLGLPAVVGGEPYSLTATMRKDSEVRFVSRADFESLIQDEPWLYPSVLQVLATEIRSARLAFSQR
jgi:CRP/FNR family transcriptional regulator, cyclic AMP receptor protein